MRTVHHLEEEMMYFGIDRALVYNLKSYLLHPDYGNRELLAHIAGHRGLYPSWVLLPEHTLEMETLEELLGKLKENRILAVRMNASLLGYPLQEWAVGRILSVLEAEKIPLFMDDEAQSATQRPTQETWLAFCDICESHPELKVVASMTGRGARIIYPMMGRYGNLYLSTSQFDSTHGIEDVVDAFGAERILFGTYYPFSPAAHVNQIVYANISFDDKQLIASQNLERMLGLSHYEKISTMANQTNETHSVIVETARKGLPLKRMLVIDSHVHVGPAAYQYRWTGDASGEKLIGIMDRVGLTKIVITHYFGLRGDMITGNTLVSEMVSEHPNRFIGYAVIDASYPTADVENEIIRCFERLRFNGIKINPTGHNVHLLDERYEPVWEAAQKYDVPVLSHTSIEELEGPNADVRHFEALATKYPKDKFIIAHCGDHIKGLKASLEIAKKHENVYLDTSGNSAFRQGVIETMFKEIGSDRILFGTDATSWDFAFAMGPFLYAKIPEEAKKRIFGENLARLLKLDISS